MNSKELFSKFLSQCMQGHGKNALITAKKISLVGLKNKHKKVINGFIKRFSSREVGNKNNLSSIEILIRIYENYWHKTFLNNGKSNPAEKELLSKTKHWLIEYRNVRTKTSFLDKVEKLIQKEVEKMGYFCLTGKVLPLRELEIWREQPSKTYNVKLQESTEKVKVILMKDYLTKGWMDYATIGLNFPGGWAKKEGLYCNTHAFRLNSERFLISFLLHEVQHYSDFKKFPLLNSIDLEYRAKLAELSMAKKTCRALVKSFIFRANKNNKNSPHAFANYCVIRDLSKKILGSNDFQAFADSPKLFKPMLINKAAGELLIENSRQLRSKGAKRIKSIIS